eukprot:CAMPEP_0172512252 /NCGR_PEP_ID=MMETSP1066-20121228/242866_1 /TAXON_ID=671091 /ORGANISM="Coscinodiscus wailesii, Strain CCMP2513" /LENGTH=347 /DNA_ID=CAMNT_0013291973 /DNA_START=96 /DNA_END=1139 /DNA_ORIENTATION=+
MSSNPNASPPETNPVLSGYESFVQNTPLVTRYVMTTLTVSWFVSWFVDPVFPLANIPLFTIYHFELYRIVLSPLICSSLLSLIFAYISFTDNGKRLEYSMGSTGFLWLILTIGGMTNLVFVAVCLFFYYVTAAQAFLVMPSQGIWIILLGVIAVECSNAPEGTKRKLFVFEVPTLYYPIAILFLFSLFGGFSLAYLISVGVGYAYGYGYLDRLKVTNATFTRWEDGCLNNFTRRQGWVVGHAATGANAWLPLNNPAGNEEGGGWTPTAITRGRNANQETGGTVASAPSGGWGTPAKKDASSSKPAFPSSRGQTLGGGSTRTSDDARAARLAALERRAAASQGEENTP